MQGYPVFSIAGPYAFTPPGKTPLSNATFTRLVEAQAHLKYDLGVLADDEQETAPTPLSPPWRRITAEVQTLVLEKQGIRLGIILFPKAAANPRTQFHNIAARAERLHRTCDLVLGVSPWGKRLEGRFLQAHPGSVDILHGSGPGGPLPFRLTDNKQTVWVRPYNKGKTVQRIDILTLPGPAATSWEKGKNVRLQLIPLKESLPEEAAVTQALEQ